MKRIAEDRLIKWIGSDYRKPIVIRGARQVGKSTLVQQFARHQGLTLHEVNLERHRSLAPVFATHDTDRILKEIQFICKKGPVKGEADLLFLDEIQTVPEAIQTLRYFMEDQPHIPVIAAGSLLELALSQRNFSMPVGRIEYLFMEPMSFEEILTAMEEDALLGLLKTWHPDEPFPASAHDRLLTIQRNCLLVGGMPEAVLRFIETQDMEQVAEAHASLVETYRDDFSKYATQSELLRLHKVFDFVPHGIGKKFKFTRVDPNEPSRNLSKALDLLTKAGVVRKAHHTDASGIPLGATVNRRIFKPFFLDYGLANSMCGINWITMEEMQKREFINEGKMTEQFIAQHICLLGKMNKSPVLTYWLREGRSTNAEVDFVIQCNGRIVPVEVKAGKSGSLKSLLQFMSLKNCDLAVRFDLNGPSILSVEHSIVQKKGSVRVEFDLLSLPLYMAEQLPRIISEYEKSKGTV